MNQDAIEYVKDMSPRDLLDAFVVMAQADYYDPHETPRQVTQLRKRGIKTSDLQEEVLLRMSS